MDDNSKAKLETIQKGADQTIYSVQTFFPMDIFPNSIVVDKNKIDIIYRHFFWSKNVFTIMLIDLTTIKIHTGPLFATVYFEVRGYESNPEPVEYVKKDEAIKLREIVIGLTKATRENITLNKVTDKQLRALQKIGHAGENISAAV